MCLLCTNLCFNIVRLSNTVYSYLVIVYSSNSPALEASDVEIRKERTVSQVKHKLKADLLEIANKT